MLTLSQQVVPIVQKYKYLGSHARDPQLDFRTKIGKCWAILKSYDGIWDCGAAADVKTRLFDALISPVLLSGSIFWPTTQVFVDRVHGVTNRMLRYVLRCDFKTPSETLRPTRPLITTQILQQRLSAWGHWIRAHYLHQTHHICIELFARPHLKLKKRRGGQRQQFWKSLCLDAGVDLPEDLVEFAVDKRKWEKLIKSRMREHEPRRFSLILHRRKQRGENIDSYAAQLISSRQAIVA